VSGLETKVAVRGVCANLLGEGSLFMTLILGLLKGFPREAHTIKVSICACALALLATPAAAAPFHDAVKAGDIAQVKLLIARKVRTSTSHSPVGAPFITLPFREMWKWPKYFWLKVPM